MLPFTRMAIGACSRPLHLQFRTQMRDPSPPSLGSMCPNEVLPMNSSEQPSPNRRIRVFISSTFRDMVEERNDLMTHTWPELRRLCQERHVELVEVDLRLGVAEAQSSRRETLKLCLDEIRACRPFFLCLRASAMAGWWSHSRSAIKAAARCTPRSRSTRGRSGTRCATNRLMDLTEPVRSC